MSSLMHVAELALMDAVPTAPVCAAIRLLHGDTLTEMECERLFQYALACFIACAATNDPTAPDWTAFLVRFTSGGRAPVRTTAAALLVLYTEPRPAAFVGGGPAAAMERCGLDPGGACLVLFDRGGGVAAVCMPPSLPADAPASECGRFVRIRSTAFSGVVSCGCVRMSFVHRTRATRCGSTPRPDV